MATLPAARVAARALIPMVPGLPGAGGMVSTSRVAAGQPDAHPWRT
jgi:hypothetical protein